MTKKEVCQANQAIAYYGITNNFSIIIKFIEYSDEEYVYFETRGGTKTTYHKAKVHCKNDGESYFNYGKFKIYTDECVIY